MPWEGRFEEKYNHDALRFSSSFGFDKSLFEEDILVDYTHAKMLNSIGLLSENELNMILDGLQKIKKEWNENFWRPDDDQFEDIHSAIESRLYEIAGSAAGKLHTGRSRNDQIATVMKLWVKKSSTDLLQAIERLQETLLLLAEKNINTIIPGYTHLQRAQPISLAFHFLAYVEMIARDHIRLQDVIDEANTCPLGACALAGSTLELDRWFVSEALNFSHPSGNALDSVSDRDFMLDFLHACSMGMMHLSRLSEELIIWSSVEWNFIKLSDQFTTGTTLQPQKKNPDVAELIRGKTGRVYGNLFSLFTTMKGLPLSYNRDLQEDKVPVFFSYDSYLKSLNLTSEMIRSMKINKDRFVEELKGDFIFATDLAEWLVNKGMTFKESHNIVGSLVKKLEEEGKTFLDADLAYMKNINQIFDESALECIKIENCLERKKTIGSPNPVFVKEEINLWKENLQKHYYKKIFTD